MASVIEQIPYNEYTANGVATVYPFEFELLQSADLVVSFDGVEQPASIFTLAGVGVQEGGTVTFDAAPTAGVKVLLERRIKLERTTDYQNNGDLRAPVLNLDFKRLWQALQQQGAGQESALRAPFPEVLDQLPAALDRRGLQLLFHPATGQPYLAAPVSGSAADVLLQISARSNINQGAGIVGEDLSLNYVAGTVGWWDRHAGVSLLRYMPITLLAAIVAGTNIDDLSAYVQEALDDQLALGFELNGHGYTYKVDNPLTWQRSSAGHTKTMSLHCATFDCGALVGAEVALTVGATSSTFFLEDGRIVMREVFLRGPETADPRDTANTTTLTGLAMTFAGQVTLDNVGAVGFFKNYYSKWAFPVTGINCNFRRGWISMHFDEASNRQTWIETNCVNSRYGVLIRSESTSLDSGKSNTLTFQGLWTEGTSVPFHIDTDAGVAGSGQIRHRGIKVIAPYLSSPSSAINQYDFFRIGIRWALATPSVRGANCTEFVSDVSIDCTGGLINPTAGAWSPAQAFVVFDTTNARCKNFQLNAIVDGDRIDGDAFVNAPLAGWARTSGYPGVSDGIVEEVWWDQGTVVRRLWPDGTVTVGQKSTLGDASQIGVEISPDGSISQTTNAEPAQRVNRQGGDGAATAWYNDEVLAGAVNVSGATIVLLLDAVNNVAISNGTGSPEGAVAAGIGSIYTNRSGGTSTTLYVKTSGVGNTGWTAK